jgi:hypothetical protein
VDKLGVIDPAQARRRDPELGMPQLPLDDGSGTPSRDISSARRPQLVEREPTTNTG